MRISRTRSTAIPNSRFASVTTMASVGSSPSGRGYVVGPSTPSISNVAMSLLRSPAGPQRYNDTDDAGALAVTRTVRDVRCSAQQGPRRPNRWSRR
jgi:hypothetical protein